MDDIDISSEVKDAITERRPVVALESTLITHGFAYPRNIEIAIDIQDVVRQAGALPATIAVLGGKVTIGLSTEQLQHLATTHDARKCSTRDLGLVAGLGLDGSTTVAATMFIAARAGISVFATGGIGGVHRGHPFDVSADLTELGRTPVTVVCAGPKALLDLPLTLEHLETLGVPVITYESDDIPAFYSRSSGLRADIRVDTPANLAAIIRARRALQLPGGELVCVPVPKESELSRDTAETAIRAAQQMADDLGIHGAAATPFMLEEIAKRTKGASMLANIALLLNNAHVAAMLAIALCA
ncbi:MAG TPA: pseudouridine-5'-phosphate glycosidase [Anaerolineae bacterium]